MRTNPIATIAHARTVATAPRTYGGGFASSGSTPEQRLRRLVGAQLLFEGQHYRSGDAAASDLRAACDAAPAEVVARLAVEAATAWKLRHTPLYMLATLLLRSDAPERLVRPALEQAVTRADSLTELVAIWAKVRGVETSAVKRHLPPMLKRALRNVFPRFDAYQLSKYDRPEAVRLRDVLFLSHPKPMDAAQGAIWAQLAAGTLPPADTWEVALSTGAAKRDAWLRLLDERKLGDLAFLRNLRAMRAAGIPQDVLSSQLSERRFARMLPFQFIAAAREVPALEADLDAALLRAVAGEPRLPGHTLLVVDVSGSMAAALSTRSTLDRLDAACGLAMLVRQQCERVTIVATAGDDGRRIHSSVVLPARSGMALRDAIHQSPRYVGRGGIFLTQVLSWVKREVGESFDRVVVITDEQDCDTTSERSPDRAPKLAPRNYILNVGAYDMGLKVKAYWDTVSGFSEASVRYIVFAEQDAQQQLAVRPCAAAPQE